jgi:hypothetical protein
MNWGEWKNNFLANRLANDEFFTNRVSEALLGGIDEYCRQTKCLTGYKSFEVTASDADVIIQDLSATVPWIGLEVLSDDVTWNGKSPLRKINFRTLQSRLADVTATTNPGVPDVFAINTEGNDLYLYLDPPPNETANVELNVAWKPYYGSDSSDVYFSDRDRQEIENIAVQVCMLDDNRIETALAYQALSKEKKYDRHLDSINARSSSRRIQKQ